MTGRIIRKTEPRADAGRAKLITRDGGRRFGDGFAVGRAHDQLLELRRRDVQCVLAGGDALDEPEVGIGQLVHAGLERRHTALHLELG